MSRFDIIHVARSRKQWQLRGVWFSCALVAYVCVKVFSHHIAGEHGLWDFVGASIGAVLLYELLTRAVIPLRQTVASVRDLQVEERHIVQRVRQFYSTYPRRNKGEKFKLALGLAGRSVQEFEFAIAAGMWAEGREVWVTAFCHHSRVRKVFASIGSARRCKPTENVYAYPNHIRRLECDEIRQYHNHPGPTTRTEPSRIDIQTAASLSGFLAPYRSTCRHYIVYHNEAGEHRILEYDGSGQSLVVFHFDICAGDKAHAATRTQP